MLNSFRDENNMYISSVQIQLHFISTSYATRSTVTRHYPFLCSYARSNSQISEILVDIAGFHSYRLITSIQWRSQVPAFGGQRASVASKDGNPGACLRKNFWGHALEMLGKRGKRPFQLYFAS